MITDNGDWGDMQGPNFELWDDVFYSVAQWMCQHRAHREAAPAGSHIASPATDNMACDWCYDEAYHLLKDGGWGDLLAVYGSVAYASGRDGVPEGEAAKRALQAVVERSSEIEGASVLLAELDQSGWWRLPLEHTEQGPLSQGDEPERSAGV